MENQIEEIIDIIEKDYYQSEKELCDIEVEIATQIFDSQKIVHVTDTSNIEIIVLGDI